MSLLPGLDLGPPISAADRTLLQTAADPHPAPEPVMNSSPVTPKRPATAAYASPDHTIDLPTSHVVESRTVVPIHSHNGSELNGKAVPPTPPQVPIKTKEVNGGLHGRHLDSTESLNHPPPAYNADVRAPAVDVNRHQGEATTHNVVDPKVVNTRIQNAEDERKEIAALASHPHPPPDTKEIPYTAPQVLASTQGKALNSTDPAAIERALEKTRADRRELAHERPQGTIVQGLEDYKLHALMRRFDQQVTHTLTLTSQTIPIGEPDLRRTKLRAVPFNSDVLKSNLERCYATVGIVFIRLAREVVRLRSWAPHEKTRTIYFCSAYFGAWVLGYAVPLIIAFLIVLTVMPESRHFCFPPELPILDVVPTAANPTSHEGDADLFQEADHQLAHKKSEQVEEKAWEFTQLAQGFLVKVAMGGGVSRGQGNATLGEKKIESDSDTDDEPHGLAEKLEQQRDSAASNAINKLHAPPGEEDTKKSKKKAAKEAKIKRDQMIGTYTKGAQDALGDIADLFECMANALAPPPPFPPNYARYKLAGAILLPICLATAVVPAWIWGRLITFSFGFGFFGDPIIWRGVDLFVKYVPNWPELLDLRNSLLSGVPTNDQLVLHLLRVGERAGHPIPRPPPAPIEGTAKEHLADHGPDPDAELVDDDGNPIDVEDLGTKDKAVHKTKTALTSGFKKLSKKVAGIGGDVTVDGARKKVGGKIDRVLFSSNLKDDGSREAYPAKLDGTSGKIYIEPVDAHNGLPRVSFISQTNKTIFTRHINDIVEIKRTSVSIPRAILGWASGADIESQTLMIRMKNVHDRVQSDIARETEGMVPTEGDHYEFKSVHRREELFVRLISMGNQRWESL